MIVLNYYEIGQRIRKFRKANNLSQDALAEQVAISTTHMSHIETGNTKLSLQVLVDLAEALGVGTDDLLFDAANCRTAAVSEIQSVLDGCTPAETKIMAEVLRSTKTAIDKYL